jgi:2-polyprenyl-3-methyl-5-hydroxy-6-metoxy-1,4-benzoquinol methylase
VGFRARVELSMKSLDIALEEMGARGKIVEELVSLQKPELLDLFITYQNEAMEARKLLHESLIKLNREAEILEVGGGILALSIQLASEGFHITTVEPVGSGFSGISFIMKIYLEISSDENRRIDLIGDPIESCNFKGCFDFIFSINVLEHLENPYSVLIQLVEMLKKDGSCRTFCPNYDFPYEPHFQKWIFKRKNGAFYLPFRRAKTNIIEKSEWQGVHTSINFITLRKLERFLIQNNIKFAVNEGALQNMVYRSATDQELKNRHKLLTNVIQILFRFKIIGVIRIIPKKLWPIIDIEVFN